MHKNIILCTVILLGIITGYCLYHGNYDTKTVQAVEQSGSLKMRKFRHNKLWRDKGPDRMEQLDGAIIHYVVLDDEQYTKQLGAKLMEEAEEVAQAQSHEDLVAEVGDALEVLDCIIAHHNLSREEIEAARTAKREERGSFLERKFVTVSEYVPGGYGEQYTLKDPRLIEIFD